MKIGIIVLCRFNSTRLPGKILREIRGRAVLGHILDRIHRAAPDLPVVVATSSEVSDDPIARYCRRSAVDCFRGDLDDVAGRFLECASSRGYDYAVRINGDNLFVDPLTLIEMLAIAGTGYYDFVTNVPGRTFPYGMSVEIVSSSFYASVIANMNDPADREHVTKWLYDHPSLGTRHVHLNRTCPEAAGMKMALDTEADFKRSELLLAVMGHDPASVSLKNLIAYAKHPTSKTWHGRHGPLLIAEIGGNHEGDYARAVDYVDMAAETGVDCIKFQLYRGDTLVSPVESPDRYKHFKRFELSRDQHIALAERCQARGVEYLASVWDLDMLEWIDPYLKRYKIGSGDMTAWPIVRAFAARGKPIIVATGLATLDEVMQTTRMIQAVDRRYERKEWLCLLQCTSMYPIPDSEANLNAMQVMRHATGLSVGYSDHTEGGFALRIAAAMGAQVLEFHFTDQREGRSFRDHKVSLLPNEVEALQNDLNRIAILQGDGLKHPQQSELSTRHIETFRRAVYPALPKLKGSVINCNDILCLRPNVGIDARDFDDVCGKRTNVDLIAFRKIKNNYFDT